MVAIPCRDQRVCWGDPALASENLSVRRDDWLSKLKKGAWSAELREERRLGLFLDG